MSSVEHRDSDIARPGRRLRMDVSTTARVKSKGHRSQRDEIDPDPQTALTRQQDARTRQLLYSALPEHDVLDTQMFAVFYDNFLPPGLSPWRSISYLAFVADTVPGTPLLKAAKRALGLTHLAQQSHNSAILQESRVLYGRLLGLLNYTLHFPGKQTRDVLVTISLMTHMSDGLESSPQQDDTWAVHLQAAQQLLMLQGPRHLQLDKSLDQGIVRHICGNSFWLAISKRKAWSVHSAWLKMQTKGWSEVIEVFHDLPQILEETDGTLAEENNLGVLLKLLSSLHQITKLARTLFTTVRDRPTVALGELKKHGISSHIQAAMARSTVFSDWYVLDQVDTQKFMFTTLLSLITECTILRIWTLCPETVMVIPQELHRSIYQNVDRLARRSCKIAPSLMQTDSIVSLFTLKLCLQMAYNIFEQQHATAEMDWCTAASRANLKRLDIVRAKGSPTLCKLEQVIPGIVEAGRYGSDFNPQSFTLNTGPSTCPRAG